MKVGVLALQGAFREHAEALDALGADAVARQAPEQLGGVDAIVLPGGESTTIDKLLDSSELRTPLRRRAARRPARARHVRRADRARAARSSTAAPTSSRSACSTSRCAATATAASGSRSRPTSTVAGLAGGPLPRRVHPRAAWSSASGAGVEVLAAHDGRPGARPPGRASGSRRSIPSSPAIFVCTSSS